MTMEHPRQSDSVRRERKERLELAVRRFVLDDCFLPCWQFFSTRSDYGSTLL